MVFGLEHWGGTAETPWSHIHGDKGVTTPGKGPSSSKMLRGLLTGDFRIMTSSAEGWSLLGEPAGGAMGNRKNGA